MFVTSSGGYSVKQVLFFAMFLSCGHWLTCSEGKRYSYRRLFFFSKSFYQRYGLVDSSRNLCILMQEKKLEEVALLGHSIIQKHPSRCVPKKRCSENMQQIYRRKPMPKCDFQKVANSRLIFYYRLMVVENWLETFAKLSNSEIL